MKYFFSWCGTAALLSFLGACTPVDVAYCRGEGWPEAAPQFTACMQDYARKEAWFQSDYSLCALEADRVYPSYLYDRPRWERVTVFDRKGRPHTRHVEVEPDYYKNRQVDRLRDSIITPCMQQKGWNSAKGWGFGRHPIPRSRR